ncbi:hypothetical protein OAG29_03660 [Planctomycetaceae bacterium]|nr:hypothetical protein [Planctomycetaceae bacterium]
MIGWGAVSVSKNLIHTCSLTWSGLTTGSMGPICMEELLTGYQSNLSTWLYYSGLLTIAVFFKFNRLWSLRNIDLFLLLAISPGLLLVKHGEVSGYVPEGQQFHTAYLGYWWLFFVSIIVLIRLLSDSRFKRRPRLEQNLNISGMLFLAVSAITFLMAKAATEPQLLRDELITSMQRDQKAEALVKVADAAHQKTVVFVLDTANEVGMQKIRLASGPDD